MFNFLSLNPSDLKGICTDSKSTNWYNDITILRKYLEFSFYILLTKDIAVTVSNKLYPKQHYKWKNGHHYLSPFQKETFENVPNISITAS